MTRTERLSRKTAFWKARNSCRAGKNAPPPDPARWLVPDIVIPTARAAFLCLHVTEAEAGTVHFGWVFDAIRPESYPHTVPAVCVAVQLVNGLGDVPVRASMIEYNAEGEAVRRLRTEPTVISFPDRLTLHRAVLRLTNCVFTRPGFWVAELECGGEVVADAPFRLYPSQEDER
jgi:hypothetical protein